jgi:hypothetical protein
VGWGGVGWGGGVAGWRGGGVTCSRAFPVVSSRVRLPRGSSSLLHPATYLRSSGWVHEQEGGACRRFTSSIVAAADFACTKCP